MHLSEASILIVDDEPQLTKIFARWMTRCGCPRVFTAGNGVEALELLGKEKVDLLISDVRMPLMDGLTMLRRILDLGLYIPGIIFISGFNDIDRRQVYASGVEAVLPKPVTLPELQASVIRCLTAREDLWQSPTLPPPYNKTDLQAIGPASAIFGRGGFCAQAPTYLEEGRIDFALPLPDLALSLSGYGVVRWCSKTGLRVGVELEYLEPEGRAAVLSLLSSYPMKAFIPDPAEVAAGLEPPANAPAAALTSSDR